MITPVASLTLFLITILTLWLAMVFTLTRAFPNRAALVIVGAGAWLAATGGIPFLYAAIGWGAATQVPTLAALAAIVTALALGAVGRRVVAANGIALLAALQAFRLPLEYVLTQWSAEGFIPVQMTWNGDNFDVVTGALAAPAAALIAMGARAWWAALLFNLLGLALLLRVASIVALSTPTPLRALLGGYETGPDVLIGLTFPGIWVATVGILSALFLHLASLRHLFRRNTEPAPYGTR
ncbi:MAG: hypothetical protein AAF909_07335 [Pseudomonadota bacterium]